MLYRRGRNQIVNDEQFAVITPAVARETQATGNHRMRADGDVRRKREERLRHDKIGELVVDHIDLDTPVGRLDQSRLERLTNSIAFQMKVSKKIPIGLADGVQHVGIEVFAVGVDRHLRTAGGDQRGVCGEIRRYAMALRR